MIKFVFKIDFLLLTPCSIFHPALNSVFYPGGVYSLLWQIWECTTERGMVFVLSVLNREHSLAQVCP